MAWSLSPLYGDQNMCNYCLGLGINTGQKGLISGKSLLRHFTTITGNFCPLSLIIDFMYYKNDLYNVAS